jgi:hypothetical protein
MFSLPSVWNLVVSTLIFVVVAWYLRRYLDAKGVSHSTARGLVVFVLAYFASWGSGEATDWVQLKIEGPTKTLQPTPPDVTELMQELEQLKQK